MSFRWFHDGCYVVAEYFDERWHIHVTDAASQPITDDRRRVAIEGVLRELSSLRGHLWHEELGKPRFDPDAIVEK